MHNSSFVFSTSLYTVRLIVNKDLEMNALHDLLNKSMNVGSPHLCCKASFYFILNSAQKLVESYD